MKERLKRQEKGKRESQRRKKRTRFLKAGVQRSVITGRGGGARGNEDGRWER